MNCEITSARSATSAFAIGAAFEAGQQAIKSGAGREGQFSFDSSTLVLKRDHLLAAAKFSLKPALRQNGSA
jgi:hypothetical protein